MNEQPRRFLERVWRSVRQTPSAATADHLSELCDSLLSERGEVSSARIASDAVAAYEQLTDRGREVFFTKLVEDYGADAKAVTTAMTAYRNEPSAMHLAALQAATESRRQELFRRLNTASGGTRILVRMRADLLRTLDAHPERFVVDTDLRHLFRSWFNRGFLVLRRVDWSTPADILERIIRHEAVHAIRDWDDLRRRVQPPDRRCYAFFHPSLDDEPLIFVEVALTREVPGSIQALLAEDREVLPPERATTAVFYSISNCQPGLKGVSFGNFLIKQVVEELSREVPSLATFVTLSPAPGFGRWLDRAAADPAAAGLDGTDTAALAALRAPGWHRDPAAERLRPLLLGLAAHYYLRAKGPGGKPLDPVARFHLGNGARLERLNWPGDTSAKGLREAAGLMVNYLYDPRSIEANHGTVVAADAVKRNLPVPTAQHATETARV